MEEEENVKKIVRWRWTRSKGGEDGEAEEEKRWRDVEKQSVGAGQCSPVASRNL